MPELTPTQLAVFRLLAAGHQLVAIAQQLGLTRYAVEKHTQRGRARLGAATNIQAVYLLTRAGLLDLEGRVGG